MVFRARIHQGESVCHRRLVSLVLGNNRWGEMDQTKLLLDFLLLLVGDIDDLLLLFSLGLKCSHLRLDNLFGGLDHLE